MRLPPFDSGRLLEVGRKVRALFPSREPERVQATVDERFLAALVERVTEGFGGKVTVAPRLFLRELVDVLDRVDQFPEHSPHQHYRLEVDEASLRPEELSARRGTLVAEEAAEGEPPSPRLARRLEG